RLYDGSDVEFLIRRHCPFLLAAPVGDLQLRVASLELPDFTIGPQTQIAVAGPFKKQPGDNFKAARGVEARSRLARERFIVDKAVGTGRADGRFVQVLGITFATLQAG